MEAAQAKVELDDLAMLKVNWYVQRTASAEKDTRTQTIASPGIALPATSDFSRFT
jgi:hypothetical protein